MIVERPVVRQAPGERADVVNARTLEHECKRASRAAA